MSINWVPNILGPSGELPSIPGITGFAAYNRVANAVGVEVRKVDNLNTSGSGSFSDAVQDSGGKAAVVFEVAGHIQKAGDTVIRQDDIHIAGQTAPYPGITIQSHSNKIEANNVNIEHVRFMSSDRHTNGGTNSNGYDNRDAININGDYENILFNHCTFAFGIDGSVDIWGDKDSASRSRNITFRNCMVAPSLNWSIHPGGSGDDAFENLQGHPLAFLTDQKGERLDITGTVIAYANERMPRVGFDNFMFCNNLIYGPNRPFFIDLYLWNIATGNAGISSNIAGNVMIADRSSCFPVNINFALDTAGAKGLIRTYCEHNRRFLNNSATVSDIPTGNDRRRTSELNSGAYVMESSPIAAATPHGFTVPVIPVNEADVLGFSGPFPAFHSSLEAKIKNNIANRVGEIPNVYTDIPQAAFDAVLNTQGISYDDQYNTPPISTAARYNLASGGWNNYKDWPILPGVVLARKKFNVPNSSVVLPSGYTRLEAALHACSRYVELGQGAQNQSAIDTEGRGWTA